MASACPSTPCSTTPVPSDTVTVPVTISSKPESAAPALSPLSMEAPTTMTRASYTDRSLDVHTLGSDGEREVVETVAGSTHLPDEELPKWRTLLDEREHHDSSGQKLFNPIAADEP